MKRSLSRISLLVSQFCAISLLTSGLTAGTEESNEKPRNAGEGNDKWSVNQPPLPLFDLSLDVREGTWMSLDVSPDGKEIVFDLLGDLFVIPFDGGQAKPLRTGLAWHHQPRFSPNGQKIAFTSDEGGGDNIWIMNRDGSNANQITKEEFRLLNSPTWSPDGEFIAARKHFTSARSLGAGEIWLYHRSGGQGLQMTERPNDQKDLGEPAFSPDGRHLYFSQDTTPGGTFQYNKDPNPGIYSIRRLDRETSEIDTFISGSGGAIRPTPSPDGKSIAYITRIRGQSVLFLMDLDSGRETRLYNGLDRDLQETWAIHGVYPAMAWTPDSSQLVFWAGGGIRRITVATREVTEIPFRAEQTRPAVETWRVKVNPDPDTFTTRILRWVQVSPCGSRVVFQALGYLYIRELPDGEPRRLNRQDDHFEFYPAWSPDGREIVYTTWNDRFLGSIRVASVEGGQPRTLTRRPGHFIEPVFSPDARHVIFRAVGGGHLTSPEWSLETGIFEVAAGGGQMRRIHRSGVQPQFGPSPERLYLLINDGHDKCRLISVDRNGRDERTHIEAGFASSFHISPDGRWIAFTELFHAYVAPFVATGRRVQLDPKSRAIPMQRVTRDAGDFLHWSGDSETLHWTLGPELFSRKLSDAFAFLEGAPETLPEPPAEGLLIGFEQPAHRPEGMIALRGGRIVTMNGNEVIENGTVLIDGNRIQAVGPVAEIDIPDQAHVLDVSGQTVLPGFIDVHWHGRQGQHQVIPQQNWYNYATLAFGVTTLHDPSNSSHQIFGAAELARAGLITAPRIFSTGTILYGARTRTMAEVNSLKDALTHVRRMRALGAISVKSYNQPRRDQRQQMLAAAREVGLQVYPEGGSLFQHNMSMVFDGHTGIEHALPLARVYEDVLQAWSQTQVGYTPTLVVAYGGLWGEEYWYAESPVWNHSRLSRFVPRTVLDARARRGTITPPDEHNHIQAAATATALQEAGVNVQLGAHGQREGLGAHWELWSFVQGGMSPSDALRTATIDAARYIGMEDHLGALEPGKLADIIVIDGNPLDDIRQSEQVTYVMVNGGLFDAATMNRLGHDPAERQPFWFENCERNNTTDLAKAGRTPAIIAHRGAMSERPENTMTAIEHAVSLGAGAVEIDVRTSADGHLFLLHDVRLDRTTSGSGRASDLALEELKALDAGSWFSEEFAGEPIPSLAQALQWSHTHEVDLLLDLKEFGTGFARRLSKAVIEHGNPDRVILGVRSPEQARQFRELLSGTRQIGFIPSPGSIEDFAGAGVDIIRLWLRWLDEDPQLAAQVRDTGRLLLVNGTTGHLEETRQLLEHAPDWILIDDVAQLKKSIRQLQFTPAR